MAVNNDIRIRAIYMLYQLTKKLEHKLININRFIMDSKLKYKYNLGDRVTTTIRDKVYIGTVVDRQKVIYTTGEDGFVQIYVEWDEPEENWTDGIQWFNQIHLAKLED